MPVKVLAVLVALLFLACSQAEAPPEVEIVRVPVYIEVIEEVLVEVEVPVEVLVEVEVPVAPTNCPPASEVDWLVANLEWGRAAHLHWSELLADNPPEEGSVLQMAVVDAAQQLTFVAMYDRRLNVTLQFQQVCSP